MKYSYDDSGNVDVRSISTLLAPQITGQPVEQVATPGKIASFSVVVADARAVTFQWKFNGTGIPGATGDSLLLPNVSAANEGKYSVVVTNSAGNVTSASAALMLGSDRDGPRAPLPPGLIALWRGETDASDLIGGHDGTFFAGEVVTAPSITASGKVGGAFDFDGTVNVRVPDNAALRPTQFTAEAWVFPTVPTSRQTVVARGDFMNTWMLELINNEPNFWSHGADHFGNDHFGKVPSRPIPLNEWTHLAISFDGTIKRLYINGAEVASKEKLKALFYDAAPVPITIGSEWSNNKGGRFFNGRIDEVALYNRALTADEVYSIYEAGSLGKNLSQPYFTLPAQLPDGVLGANYTQQVVAVAGISPLSFSLSAGVLPPGITLSSTGLVSGVPGVAGTFHFTMRATDSLNAFTEQLYTLKVQA